MQIVFDEVKRVANLAKHGLDFENLDMEFFARARVGPAKNGRSKVIGEFRGELVIVVIIKPLGSEAPSVISMPPASQSERRLADG